MPEAIEECRALGLKGMRGSVAGSKAYSRRPLGLEPKIDLVTLVPCWRGQSVYRHLEVEYSAGRVAQEQRRLVVVHASPLAQQHTQS
jgi:hypothetical protein